MIKICVVATQLSQDSSKKMVLGDWQEKWIWNVSEVYFIDLEIAESTFICALQIQWHVLVFWFKPSSDHWTKIKL